MMEPAATLFIGALSVLVAAWVLWVLFWMAFDVAAAASAAVRAVKRSVAWPRAEAKVTGNHPDADVRKARLSVAFDLPGGGSAAATLPKLPPVLWAGSERGPQVFPRTMGRFLLSLMPDVDPGARIAVVFDPIDPRRAEHRVGIACAVGAVASPAVSLAILGSFGLGVAVPLLDFWLFS